MSPTGAYLLSVMPAARRSGWTRISRRTSSRKCGRARGRRSSPTWCRAKSFKDTSLSLAPGTGAVFSVIPPENATGNFTKIVQRVPVRIALDDDDATLGALRPGLSTTVSVDTRSIDAGVTDAAPPAARVLPFVVMCVGMFIALLDIQIVASSLQDIGGGLSAAQDEISWVQTAYLIAEIVMIPLSGWLTRVFSTRWLFTASAAGLHGRQPALRARLEHPEHDRVPRAAGRCSAPR